MDVTKAQLVLKAALELHADHINGSEPTDAKSQQRLMDLLETAYKALGGGKADHRG